jgi:MOSC domain-containing protein YiiM
MRSALARLVPRNDARERAARVCARITSTTLRTAGQYRYSANVAKLLAIYLRPSARTPVRKVDTATVTAEVGIDGDHAVGGKRQITLLTIEGWQQACEELGHAVDPSVRRANLLIEGLDLAAHIGGSVKVGPVIIDITGETHPCELLDDGNVGLSNALRSDRRAGVFGTVRVGGELHVGAECTEHTA